LAAPLVKKLLITTSFPRSEDGLPKKTSAPLLVRFVTKDGVTHERIPYEGGKLFELPVGMRTWITMSPHFRDITFKPDDQGGYVARVKLTELSDFSSTRE